MTDVFSLLFNFIILMNAYALNIIEWHSWKVGIDEAFEHVCERVSEFYKGSGTGLANQILVRANQPPNTHTCTHMHTRTLTLSKNYCSEADHDDKMPSINLLHSGQ